MPRISDDVTNPSRSLSASGPAEAHYLAAFLNAPVVDAAIKPYQPRRLFSAASGGSQRHIHRRPFEVVPIPRFDPSDARHQRLAELSQRCHDTLARLAIPSTEPVGRARKRVREALRTELMEIDDLVRAILASLSGEEMVGVSTREVQQGLEPLK